jgi:hypothetical protein
MKSERKSIENEYCRIGSVVVSERYSGMLLYTSAVKRMMCVVLVTSGKSCEVFSLGLVLWNSEVVSMLGC